MIESGFVEQYPSYTAKRKTTLYRIIDEFCLFHLQSIEPYKGNRWSQLYTKKVYNTWTGYAFEMICYKHIENIKSALRCDQINSKNYSWSSAKAQVDLVIERDDNMINLCEIKFYNDTYLIDASYAEKLRNKETQYSLESKTRKAVNTIMMTTWGVTGTQAIGLVTKSLTMDCLFE